MFATQRPFLVGKARKKTDIAKSCQKLFSKTAKSELWRHRSNESDGVSQVMAGLL